MRTTLSRQLRRFDSHGSVAEAIITDFNLSAQQNNTLVDISKNYIIAYHRTIRRAKPLPQEPVKQHRRSRNRRSK